MAGEKSQLLRSLFLQEFICQHSYKTQEYLQMSVTLAMEQAEKEDPRGLIASRKAIM